jgi:hypothetical protein
MNSRTIVIVIVAGFAQCCIGSGAVMTLSVLDKALASAKDDTGPVTAVTPPKPDEDTPDDDQPVAPPADTDDTPDDDETIPTANRDGDDGEAPEYVPPEEGSSTFAVYYAKKSKLPVAGALALAVKGTALHALKRGELVDEAEAPFIAVEEQPTLDYPVDAEALEKATLDASSRKLLENSQSVAVLTVVTSGDATEERDAQKAVLAFAKATGGVLWDDDSNEFFPAAGFKTQRLDGWAGDLPLAANFYSVIENGDGKRVSLATRGLKRFALPELELHDVAMADVPRARAFLAVVAQTLVENADTPPDETNKLAVSIAALQHPAAKAQAEAAGSSGVGSALVNFKTVGDSELPALQVRFSTGSLSEFFGN